MEHNIEYDEFWSDWYQKLDQLEEEMLDKAYDEFWVNYYRELAELEEEKLDQAYGDYWNEFIDEHLLDGTGYYEH
jgi:hypothetical protein